MSSVLTPVSPHFSVNQYEVALAQENLLKRGKEYIIDRLATDIKYTIFIFNGA